LKGEALKNLAALKVACQPKTVSPKFGASAKKMVWLKMNCGRLWHTVAEGLTCREILKAEIR